MNNERPRPETGAMRFGSDWAGIFMRGDDAFFLSLTIDNLIHFISELPIEKADAIYLMQLKNLSTLLKSCDERNAIESIQQMKDFVSCLQSE